MNTDVPSEDLVEIHSLCEELLKAEGVEPLLRVVEEIFNEMFEGLKFDVQKDPEGSVLGIAAMIAAHYGKDVAIEKLSPVASKQ